MLREFKKFALRGNVVDMAVGIIIGAAFSDLVSSLVQDVVMPPVGLLLGNVDFSNLAIILQNKTTTHPEIAIKYGQFISSLIDFIILAFIIFLMVRQMNKLSQQHEAKPPAIKMCPFCCSDIPVKATRCPDCTSELE
ncbi:large-conductance mechanosensitive channel protein MscL [Legionella yabuuchiae]|uniref:large-conductance mechanosensitive channel protein MscL n=1 Tax=Legionella yabuuchiae TaxID=376727 RepID=UPI0010548356|nr:large-conductance mechanosensitive channel protein MscL [Legionella yabuuchiae]